MFILKDSSTNWYLSKSLLRTLFFLLTYTVGEYFSLMHSGTL